MARNLIVVGDATTGGGRVLTGSPFTDIYGKCVARIGDKATCPLHKGIFPIVTGDPSLMIDGQPAALHNSSLACGCTLLSTQQSHVHDDCEGGSGAWKALATSVAAPIAALRNDKPAVCEECLLAAAKRSAAFLGR